MGRCLVDLWKVKPESLVGVTIANQAHSLCRTQGVLGVALESLQGQIDLIYACVQDLVFHYWADRDSFLANVFVPKPPTS